MVKVALSSDRNWLVRSATRILGPFTLDEVKELLLTRQISIIDEVRSTEGRWSYVRENKDFAETVKKVREQMDNFSENTMTQSVAQHTMTRSETIPGVAEDLTPTPPGHQRRSSDQQQLRDVTPAEKNFSSRSGGPVKSYGSHSDLRVQEKISHKNTFLRWGILGVVILVLGVAGMQYLNKEKKTNVDFDGTLKKALRYRSLGLYEESLSSYKKALVLREPNFEAQVRMAPVLISVDHQTLTGRRILEKSLNKPGRSRAEMIETYNALGLSYLLEGDLREAEVVLQKALGFDQSNFEAQLNVAAIRMRQGRPEEARQLFTNIVARTGGAPLSVLGQVLSSLEAYGQDKSKEALIPLRTSLQKAREQSGYLRQELSLLQIYTDVLQGNESHIQESVVQFLAEYSGESKKYVKNLLVDTRMAQWEYLERYCADIYKERAPGPQMKALRAVCLMELNRDSEAIKLIDEALAELPSDPYILITQASYLKKMGKYQEAFALLKRPELSALPKRNHIIGEICMESKDVNCLTTTFNDLYGKNFRDAYTMSGLAWLAEQGADRTRTYEYIRIGLKADAQYIPLLQLRDKMETE